ncbi:MAG: pyruvate kinase [Gemmatimonadota bacterium]|nr:pyruvate kinase [Gemmatimonadota bacterium]
MLRTKVVCTLGPASSAPATILEMVRGGMDVARINMSHGEREDHRRAIEAVRFAADKTGRPVAILVDLSGPKIRVGDLEEPIELSVGDSVVLAPAGAAGPGEIPTTYEPLSREIKAGQSVLMDDGLLELRCVGTDGARTRLEVVRGGTLKSRKGINLPEVNVQAPSLTPKDLEDLDFALEMGAEYVALSFVRRPEDVVDLKERIGGRALVVAKIEKVQALQNIEEILAETDAVMVARGDLGVELPFERVPLAQKRIVQLANFYGRPVITATQMLESMIDYPRPTRAEASDVANAILDGTDAVMLSGETAVGDFPLLALEALVRIGTEVQRSGAMERGPRYVTSPIGRARGGASPREHAVAAATVDAVRQVGAPAIIVITRSGFSARLVSSYRPPVPIFAVTTDHLTYRQMAAVWGVRPVLAVDLEVTYESLTRLGCREVLAAGLGESGAPVVVTAGYPFHTSGSTNTMRLERI